MSTASLEKLYHEHIKPISVAEKLELISLISRELVEQSAREQKKPRSLLELRGKGADLWHDVEPQEYVNNLRDEWDAGE